MVLVVIFVVFGNGHEPFVPIVDLVELIADVVSSILVVSVLEGHGHDSVVVVLIEAVNTIGLAIVDSLLYILCGLLVPRPELLSSDLQGV